MATLLSSKPYPSDWRCEVKKMIAVVKEERQAGRTGWWVLLWEFWDFWNVCILSEVSLPKRKSWKNSSPKIIILENLRSLFCLVWLLKCIFMAIFLCLFFPLPPQSTDQLDLLIFSNKNQLSILVQISSFCWSSSLISSFLTLECEIFHYQLMFYKYLNTHWAFLLFGWYQC